MNYQETLNFLYEALPMYQRVGKSAFKKDLGNTIALCAALDNPQNKFKSVHVAGTNGKGSSSHLIASILQEAGYKVGLYTSPHLKSFTERIRINGKAISESSIVGFVEEHKRDIEEIGPSFFEMTVAMAFDQFAKNVVDIAVIEVGLGGRLDSTNIIKPEACLITNIGFDHMDMLGDTLPLIAGEKAGIIKPNTPVVISERHSETEEVFRQKAIDEHAPISFADELGLPHYETALKGKHQEKNVLGVQGLIEVLVKQGWKITSADIKNGLLNVLENTQLKGRWQILGKDPFVVCDTGHNKEAFEYIIDSIKETEYNNLFMVLGFVRDKNVTELLKKLPRANYIFTVPNVPRGMPLAELKEITTQLDIEAVYIEEVNEAITQARIEAKANDMIFIGGSTFVVAEIDEL